MKLILFILFISQNVFAGVGPSGIVVVGTDKPTGGGGGFPTAQHPGGGGPGPAGPDRRQVEADNRRRQREREAEERREETKRVDEERRVAAAAYEQGQVRVKAYFEQQRVKCIRDTQALRTEYGNQVPHTVRDYYVGEIVSTENRLADWEYSLKDAPNDGNVPTWLEEITLDKQKIADLREEMRVRIQRADTTEIFAFADRSRGDLNSPTVKAHLDRGARKALEQEIGSAEGILATSQHTVNMAMSTLLYNYASEKIHAIAAFTDGVNTGVYKGFYHTAEALRAIYDSPLESAKAFTRISSDLMQYMTQRHDVKAEWHKYVEAPYQKFRLASAFDQGERVGGLVSDVLQLATTGRLIEGATKFGFESTALIDAPAKAGLEAITKDLSHVPSETLNKNFVTSIEASKMAPLAKQSGEFVDKLADWLGNNGDVRVLTNVKNDKVFLNKTAGKKVRFDIKNGGHGYGPHMHMEVWDKVKKEWVDAYDQHMFFPGKE